MYFIFCICLIDCSFYEIQRKSANTKSVVSMNWKKKLLARNTFIECNHLNGPVLKSVKLKRSGPKSEKNLTRLGPSQNDVFCFGLGLARNKILFLLRAKSGLDSSHAGPGLKIPARAHIYSSPMLNPVYPPITCLLLAKSLEDL